MTVLRWGMALLAVSAVAAAGCGDADNAYVSNSKAGVFLKLPSDWATYAYESGDPTASRLTAIPGSWRMGFDGAEDPDRAHLEGSIAPEAPIGFVEVAPIEVGAISGQSGLRSILVGGDYDPLDPDLTYEPPDPSEPSDPSAIDPSSLAVLDYDELDLGHAYGNEIHATIGAGRTEIEVIQLAMLNNAGDRVHLLRVLCSPDCFDEHRDEIDEVIDSWVLEDR